METLDIRHFINPNLSVNEGYNTLRSNILFYGSDMKILGLTSCSEKECKNDVALNLAASLAEAGNKVILVDANMCKSIHEKVVLDKLKRGLSNYLVAMNSVEEIIYETNIENLHIMLSGPITLHSSKLLSKEEFEELIMDLSCEYDYVLVNTPPLGDVIDGAIVAKVCDGMILVVKAYKVDFELSKKVKKRLEESGCPILGAIFIS